MVLSELDMAVETCTIIRGQRDALQAEVERLQRKCDWQSNQLKTLADAGWVESQKAEVERLREQLDAVLEHWQYGVQDFEDSPWRRKMAELLGDEWKGGE